MNENGEFFQKHKETEIEKINKLFPNRSTLSKLEQTRPKLFKILYDLEQLKILSVYSQKSGLIQSCTYAIEDSQSVIEEYLDLSIFEFDKIKYLALYGLLQAFFVQQDSMNTLYKTCLTREIDFKNKHKALFEIREIRNITIGHPTNRGKNYFLISQQTLKKQSYYLIGHDESDRKKGQEIEIIPKMIIDQQNGILDLFQQLLNELSIVKCKSLMSATINLDAV